MKSHLRLVFFASVATVAIPASLRAADPLAPASDPAVAAGRQVAERFGLPSLVEVTLPADDPLSPAGRKALETAAAALGRAPGVKRVVAPTSLLDVRGPALVDPPGDEQGLTVRERLPLRSDAAGWFFPRNAKAARLIVETSDAASLTGALPAGARVSALWPAGKVPPLDRKRLALIALAAAVGLLLGARFRRLGAPALVTAALAGGAAACAVLVAADIAPLQRTALLNAVAALGGAAGAAVLLRIRGGAAPTPVPTWLALGAAALGIAGAGWAWARADRLTLETGRFRSPYLFVEVQGDMEEPLVLREVRRLTDWLRSLPGVENAWSPADLFPAFTAVGDGLPRIPDDAREVRRILTSAAADGALALTLRPDRRSGLVVARLGEDAGRRATEVLTRIEIYLKAEFRTALLPIAVGDQTLPTESRTVGKGIAATDTRERIVRICERQGRRLSEDDVLGVDRVAKQSAFVQTMEPKLKDEITEAANAFLAASFPPAPGPRRPRRDPAKLVDALREQPGDATVDDVKRPLAAYAPETPEQALQEAATALHARLAEVRRIHAARINAKEMLFSADLPPSGALADEVKGATLDAMAPVIGVPVAAETVGAVRLTATVAGGAVADRALAASLRDGLRRGAGAAALAIALALLVVAGPRALVFLPLGLLPLAVLALAAIGTAAALHLPSISTAAAAAAFGSTLAVAAAAGWRRSPKEAKEAVKAS